MEDFHTKKLQQMEEKGEEAWRNEKRGLYLRSRNTTVGLKGSGSREPRHGAKGVRTEEGGVRGQRGPGSRERRPKGVGVERGGAKGGRGQGRLGTRPKEAGTEGGEGKGGQGKGRRGGRWGG